MPVVKIEGVGKVRIDAEPGTPGFDAAIDEIRQTHGGFTKAKAASSHEPPASAPTVAAHMQGPRAMQVPLTDPLTGRQQTKGRTMSTPESINYAAKALPMAGAIAGGTLATGGALPAIGAAGLLAGGGEAIRQAIPALGELLGMSHGEGRETSSYGAAKGIAIEGVKGAAAEGAGRVVGYGLGKVAEKLPAVGRAVKSALGKTSGAEILRGEKMRTVAEKAAAVSLENTAKVQLAEKTAQGIADRFTTPISQESAPQAVRTLQEGFEKTTKAAHDAAYGAIKETLAAAGKPVNLTEISKAVVELEKTVPRLKGTFRPLTEPNPEWAELVKRAEKFSKPTVREVPAEVSPILDASGKPTVTRAASSTVLPAADAGESAAALIDAKGTVSQRIRDLVAQKAKGAPINDEYLEGLRKIHAGIKEKIAEVGGPGVQSALSAVDKSFAQGAEIKASALYKIAKTHPERVPGAVLDAKFPENAAIFHKMTKTLGPEGEEMVKTVQRAAIDKLIGGDISSIHARLAAAGRSTEALFPGESYSVIQRLAQQGRAARDISAIPQIPGMPPGASISDVLLTAAPRLHGIRGATIDAATYALSRIAENPAANKSLLKGIAMLRGGETAAKNGMRYIGAAVNMVVKEQDSK